MDRRAGIIRFGVDGWHARYDEGFTKENVLRVADALGLLWADAIPSATVLIGYDTRHASAEAARDVAAVLASYGLTAKLSNVACPTPAVAWSCAHDEFAIGAVIVTSSERSCEYGGILIRDKDGGPCSLGFLNDLERVVSLSPTMSRGKYEVWDFMTPYLDSLATQVDAEAIAKARPKVVVDPMFGAAKGHLAGLLANLGCDVVEIHGDSREDFDGIHPDPKDPWADACEQAVVARGAQIGLLVDGDGDRAGVVDETGAILSASVLEELVLGHLVENRHETGRVVVTLTCSACVSRQAERLGCDVTAVPVGFSRIYREILEGDVLFGTEEYGGMCMPSHLHERDGLLVCLLAVELLAVTGKSLSELVRELEAEIGSMRYIRRDVRLENAATQAFRNILPGLNPSEIAGRKPVEVSHADGLRLQFEDDSWVLMRPSRAGSIVRVYAEAPTERQRDELLESACALVRKGI